jgi:hypothetical protein
MVDADRPGRSRPSESAAPGDAENVAPMSMLLVVAYGLQQIPLLVLVVILHAVATRNACSRREFKEVHAHVLQPIGKSARLRGTANTSIDMRANRLHVSSLFKKW